MGGVGSVGPAPPPLHQCRYQERPEIVYIHEHPSYSPVLIISSVLCVVFHVLPQQCHCVSISNMESSPEKTTHNATCSGALSAAVGLSGFLLCHELPGQEDLLLEGSLVLTLPLHTLQVSQHSLSQPLSGEWQSKVTLKAQTKSTRVLFSPLQV